MSLHAICAGMPYNVYALISVSIFAFVHLIAERARKSFSGWFLSAGGGIALAYVFIDLLPKLCLNDQVVSHAGIFPYVERHVFIMALLGFLLFFSIDRIHTRMGERETFWISIASYSLFNFLVGYAVVDQENPEVQPLGLFTFAMALHYFVNDSTLCEEHGDQYSKEGKWWLILSLFLWMDDRHIH